MARNLTQDFISQIEGTQLSPALLVKLSFDSGDTNFWTGLGDLIFRETTFLTDNNGNILTDNNDNKLENNKSTAQSDTYIGIGDVLGITAIEETQELKAKSLSITLSGLNSTIISTALNTNYQGRIARVWFAVLNNDGSLIANPHEIFIGRMDVMSFIDNGETSDFEIKCESNAIDIRKSKERRYTPEDQKIDFPNDRGLDYIPKIEDIDIVWG